MSNIAAALGRKVGPFSVGIWLVIAAAGLGLGVVIRRSMSGISGNLPPIDAAEADGSTPSTGAGYTTTPYFGTQGALIPQNGGQPAGYGGSEPDMRTNNDWVRYAVRYWADRGLYSAADVDTALRRYVQGESLTAAQAAIVSATLRDVGTPPEPVPPMKIEDSTTTPVPGAPTSPTGPAQPAVAPQLSAAELAYLSTMEQVFATIRAREAAGQNYGDQFPRLEYLGVRSSAPELSSSARGWYRTYLGGPGRRADLI